MREVVGFLTLQLIINQCFNYIIYYYKKLMRQYKKIFSLILIFLSIEHAFAQNIDTVRTIKIDVLVGLQFDLVRFNVKPGENLKLIFSNSDDMSHNLLITKPGARLEVLNEALK